MAEGDEGGIDYDEMSKAEAEERLQELLLGVVGQTRVPVDVSAEELLKMSREVFGETGGLEEQPFVGDITPTDLSAPLTAAERMQHAAPRGENNLIIDGPKLFAVAVPGGGKTLRIMVWEKRHQNTNNIWFNWEDGELLGLFNEPDNPEKVVPQPQPLGDVVVNAIEFTGGLEEGIGDEEFAWRLGMD